MVTTDYVLTVTSGNGCVRSDTVRVVVDSSITGRVISGQVVYDNAQRTPLSQAIVILENVIITPTPVRPPNPNPVVFSSPDTLTYVPQGNMGESEARVISRGESQTTANATYRSGIARVHISNRRTRHILNTLNR